MIMIKMVVTSVLSKMLYRVYRIFVKLKTSRKNRAKLCKKAITRVYGASFYREMEKVYQELVRAKE